MKEGMCQYCNTVFVLVDDRLPVHKIGNLTTEHPCYGSVEFPKECFTDPRGHSMFYLIVTFADFSETNDCRLYKTRRDARIEAHRIMATMPQKIIRVLIWPYVHAKKVG